VKAHGALYNRAAKDEAAAGAIARAARDSGEGLILVGPPGSCFEKVCLEEGVPFAAEVFADRAYAPDGSLVPRSVPGSVIEDPQVAATRAVRMVLEGKAAAMGGEEIPLKADTICLHGDTPGSAILAALVRSSLERAKVKVLPLSAFLRGVP
jgi:UPF0271 protein